MAYKTCLNCLKVSPGLLFLLIFQPVSGQDFTAADQYLQKNQKAFGTEMAVVVNKDGKPVYKKELGKDFTIKSTADAGEISQWFTTALVLVLVDEGRISLDDPVAKYIPKFEKYMKGYITIRHCLTHTTGLDVSTEGVGKFLSKSHFASLDEEVNTYIEKRDIIDNPGKAFTYSRMGISIAAKVLEAATKKTFDRLATEKLFRPLGMKNTTFYTEKGGINAFDGAVTTAGDCMLFMQMLLNKGTVNGKKILSEESCAALRKQEFPEAMIRYKPDLMKSYGYALTTWVEAKDGNGAAAILSQGMNGTLAYMDFNRNTCWLILLKDPYGDKKRNLSLELKSILNQALQ